MGNSMNNSALWCTSVAALLLGVFALYNGSTDMSQSQASLLNVPAEMTSYGVITKGGNTGGGGGGPYGFELTRGMGGTFDNIKIDIAPTVEFTGMIYAADPSTGAYNAILHNASHEPLITNLPIIVKDSSGNLWGPLVTPPL